MQPFYTDIKKYSNKTNQIEKSEGVFIFCFFHKKDRFTKRVCFLVFKLDLESFFSLGRIKKYRYLRAVEIQTQLLIIAPRPVR